MNQMYAVMVKDRTNGQVYVQDELSDKGDAQKMADMLDDSKDYSESWVEQVQ